MVKELQRGNTKRRSIIFYSGYYYDVTWQGEKIISVYNLNVEGAEIEPFSKEFIQAVKEREAQIVEYEKSKEWK